jgi:hypothetical protein
MEGVFDVPIDRNISLHRGKKPIVEFREKESEGYRDDNSEKRKTPKLFLCKLAHDDYLVTIFLEMFRPPDIPDELEWEKIEDVEHHITIISAFPCDISVRNTIHESPGVIPFASTGHKYNTDDTGDSADRRDDPIQENTANTIIIRSRVRKDSRDEENDYRK